MRRIAIGIVSLVLLTAVSWSRVAADEASEVESSKQEVSATDAKHSKDYTGSDRDAKVAAEYQARAEAENDGNGSSHRHGIDYAISAVNDASSSVLPSMGFSGVGPLKTSATLIYAPGSDSRDSAIGIQLISPKRWGVALWASGDLMGDDSIIDAPIPHEEYTMGTIKGSYAVEALYSVGSPNSMLMGGLGLSITRTEHYAVSDITGWKWEAGTDRSAKVAAQIGWRARIGGRMSMQYGYDTIHRSFLGLAVDF